MSAPTECAGHRSSAARRYALAFAVCLSLPVAGLGAFVIAVDPYQVFGSPALTGISDVRPFYGPHVVLAKPYQVRRLQPDAVTLGSSRAEVGLDPRHPGWSAGLPRFA